MSIKELVGSRTIHMTREGATLTQIFSCLWSEWEAGRGPDEITKLSRTLPRIGTVWSAWRPDLHVTDVTIEPRTNSDTECLIICTYSTGGEPWSEHLTDTAASLQDVYDFQASPGTEDSYIDAVDGTTKSWAKTYKYWYKTIYPGETIVNVPERYKPEAHISLTIRGLVGSWAWARVLDKINKVNSVDFLKWHTDRIVGWPGGRVGLRMESIQLAPGFSDTGKWLYAGFHAEHSGRNTSGYNQPSYEIQHTLIYEPQGWNTIYGVTGYKAYKTTNFTATNGLVLPATVTASWPPGLR